MVKRQSKNKSLQSLYESPVNELTFVALAKGVYGLPKKGDSLVGKAVICVGN